MKMAERTKGLSPAALVALARGDMKNFMAASTEGGIEAQERAGQLEQAALSTLPCELGSKCRGTPAEHRKVWEKLGFVFTDEIVDGIFVKVAFPAGWQKKPTDHAMWSDIVDEKGRKRGAIFYKAAFYDRSAHAHLCCRFGVTQDYPEDRSALTCVRVTDACGVVDFKVSGLEQPDWKDREEATKRDAKIEEARNTCIVFLKQNYPDYESPSAYWES